MWLWVQNNVGCYNFHVIKVFITSKISWYKSYIISLCFWNESNSCCSWVHIYFVYVCFVYESFIPPSTNPEGQIEGNTAGSGVYNPNNNIQIS